MRRLYRSRGQRMVAGVAGGIAQYLNVDPTLVRLAFVALTLVGGGIGLALYVILAIIMPLEPAPGAMRAEAAEPWTHITAEEETRKEAQETQTAEFQR